MSCIQNYLFAQGRCPGYASVYTCHDYADVNGTQNDDSIGQMKCSIDTFCCDDSIRNIKVTVCGRTVSTDNFMLSLSVLNTNGVGPSFVVKKKHYFPVFPDSTYCETFCIPLNPSSNVILCGGMTQSSGWDDWPTDDKILKGNKIQDPNLQYCGIFTGGKDINGFDGYGIKLGCSVCMFPGIPCPPPNPEDLGCYCE